MHGGVSASTGFLQLREDSCEVLGGHVEQLLREWRAARSRTLALPHGFGTSAPAFQALTKAVCSKTHTEVEDAGHRCVCAPTGTRTASTGVSATAPIAAQAQERNCC